MKTDAQVINFYRAVQHGEAIVIDATSETLAALTKNDADIVKRINLLSDMMAELTGSTRIRLSQIIGIVQDDSPQKELRHIEYDTSSGKHVEYDRLCNVQREEKPNFSESDKDIVIKDLLNPTEMPMYVDFSRENYNKLFPEGKVKSPIGDVKISPHQYERMDEKKRNAFLGVLYQVLKRLQNIRESNSQVTGMIIESFCNNGLV